MAWYRLSPELFIRIMDLLNEEDQVSCSGVCTTWYYWLNDLLLRQKKSHVLRPTVFNQNVNVPIENFYVVNFSGKDFMKLAYINNQSIKCLHIWFEKDYVADEEWIQSVLHLTNNRIYKLHFKNINFTDDSAIRLLNSIPICIETLIIQIRNDFKQLSTFLNASELFSCLCIKKDDIISLLYSGRKTNTNVDKIEKDTKIVRCSCIGLEENQFLQLLDPGQSVQKLCLINALNLSKNALDCISKMQHLNYLEITKADLISDQDWSTPFESGFKMLQSIKILDCKGFSDRSIVSLSNKSLLKEVEMELLHCIDTDVISRSLSEFRLNKLSLHIRAESLDLLDSFIYFNHPTELFILTIYPPYSPSNYFNLTKKIKNLSELFQKVGLKFDFHINYTAIKFKIK